MRDTTHTQVGERLLSLASDRVRNNDLEVTREILEATVSLCPGNSLARYHLGSALKRLGRYEEGLVPLEQAKTIRPLHTSPDVSHREVFHCCKPKIAPAKVILVHGPAYCGESSSGAALARGNNYVPVKLDYGFSVGVTSIVAISSQSRRKNRTMRGEFDGQMTKKTIVMHYITG